MVRIWIRSDSAIFGVSDLVLTCTGSRIYKIIFILDKISKPISSNSYDLFSVQFYLIGSFLLSIKVGSGSVEFFSATHYLRENEAGKRVLGPERVITFTW